jgi:alpha-ketoglutarate-dependent taurine dioxygenase
MSNEQATPPIVYGDHPAAWTAENLMDQTEKWIYHLTDEDVAELDGALKHIQAKELIVPRFGKDDFKIPKLTAKLAPYLEELNFGIGILQLKDFPIENYSKDQASAIFWGIGAHIGNPQAQNVRGHLLGDVRDEGRELSDPLARGYQTTQTLPMHTDGSDFVALLCLKQALEGGENQFCSSVAVYNKLATKSPEIARHLLDTKWCIDRRGEEAEGEAPYNKARLYTPIEGAVTCFAVVGYVFSAQRFDEVPRLTDWDKEALEEFDKATWDEDLVARVRQEEGDMLFLNNHYILHARSTYTDAEDPYEKRHLRRLWLESDQWASLRPAWQTSRTWIKPDPTVQMWDHM